MALAKPPSLRRNFAARSARDEGRRAARAEGERLRAAMEAEEARLNAAALGRRVGQHVAQGMALFRAGRRDEALEEWRAGFVLSGERDYRCVLNSSVAYLATGRYDEAEACCALACEMDPSRSEALDNWGVARLDRGDHAGAADLHRRALALRYSPTSERNLAAALERLGDTAAALDCFRRVCEADGGDAEARVGLGLARLTLGDLGGMQDLDARLDRAKHLAVQVPGVPRWDGRPLAGTLLVNQLVDGFGDAIHGIRSAAEIRRRVGRLVVLCAAPIASLLASAAGVDQVLVEGDVFPPVDAQCPALQLPWHTAAIAAGRIPWHGPYLWAEDDSIDYWRAQIGPIRGFRIGIIWQGDPKHGNDRRRSFRLEHLAPIAAIPGVSLISLQRGFGRDQIEAAPFPVHDLLADPAYEAGDLQDTAAVMESLDLVIAPDTGLAHLAGALGRPTWIAIPFVPEWRWQTARRHPDDSPWYPTARLFRQPAEGDWASVFSRMAATIAAEIEDPMAKDPVPGDVERNVVKPPNAGIPARGGADDGFLPIAPTGGMVRPTNFGLHGDRRGGTADLRGQPSPISPPNHQFVVGMGNKG